MKPRTALVISGFLFGAVLSLTLLVLLAPSPSLQGGRFPVSEVRREIPVFRTETQYSSYTKTGLRFDHPPVRPVVQELVRLLIGLRDWPRLDTALSNIKDGQLRTQVLEFSLIEVINQTDDFGVPLPLSPSTDPIGAFDDVPAEPSNNYAASDSGSPDSPAYTEELNHLSEFLGNVTDAQARGTAFVAMASAAPTVYQRDKFTSEALDALTQVPAVWEEVETVPNNSEVLPYRAFSVPDGTAAFRSEQTPPVAESDAWFFGWGFWGFAVFAGGALGGFAIWIIQKLLEDTVKRVGNHLFQPYLDRLSIAEEKAAGKTHSS